MSSPEIFTPTDLAKRYKILIVLYDQSGVGSPVCTESLLKNSYCFLNPKNHIYDMLMSEITNKHHRYQIAQNIQHGVSPIIIDNVTDLTSPSVKGFCEFAVKFGYLIDIIQDKEANPLITREDLFIEFQLCYEQEIPQLRKYPSIPRHIKSVDDTPMKEVIQRRYDPWIDKNVKQATAKNEEKEDKKVSLPDDTKDGTSPTPTERAKTKKDPPQQENCKDVTSNVQTSISSSNNVKNDAQLLKKDVKAPETNNNNETSTGNYEKEAFQAFTKSLQEDIDKKLEENKQMTMKTMKAFFEDIKKFKKELSKMLSSNVKNTDKKFEKVNSDVMEKVEELFRDMNSFTENQMESLSEQAEEQRMAFLKSSSDYMNKRFDEYDKTAKKDMENILKNMFSKNDNNLMKKVEDVLTAFMRSSQEDMNRRLNESDNAVLKRMEDVLTEIKTHNQKLEERINKKLEENNSVIINGVKDIITEMKTNNENQTQMLLKSMEQKFLANVMASNIIQFANDKVVDEKANKSTDISSNKNAEAQDVKKRTTQTQKTAPQENPINKPAYEQIIAYIKEGFKVMILIRGLPGCGKSYLANKLLQDALGTVNRSEFIFDPLEHLMRNGRFKDGDSEAAHTWNKRKCFEAVTRGVSPVIVDSTNLQLEDMRVYCLMAIENGYMIETIEVNTPWASNISVLAMKNTLNLDRKQIQMMQDYYQRNVSSGYLLKELGINYKQSLPQFRTYPPFKKAEIDKKPVEVAKKPPADHVHKFGMKYGEKTEQTDNLIDVSDAKENITANSVNKEIKKNENVEDIDDMRKKLTAQSSFIQQLLSYMPVLQSNQMNVSSMQQSKLLDYGYNQAPLSRNYPSTYEDQQNFDAYSTNQSYLPPKAVAFNSHTNSNVGNTTGNYQTSSDGFWSTKPVTVIRNREQTEEPTEN